MHDLFKEIKNDHQEVKAILEKLKESTGPKNRENLFKQLVAELKPHMEAEEKVLYPVLADKKEARENALEALEEHHVAELVLKELEKGDKQGDQWLAKMRVFSELIDHHIEEEEESVFKDAQKVLKDDQVSQIFESFQSVKQKMKKHFS
jgi:hemerythrin superfamily protein